MRRSLRSAHRLARAGGQGKEARSFLKKRTKKLFPLARVPEHPARVQVGKVFLLLFLQKKKNPSS
jgi:hypothetical protein